MTQRLLFPIALLLLLLPGLAGAGTVWLEFSGGYNKFSLTDLNAEMDSLNAAAGDGTFPQTTSGYSWGAELGWDFAGPFTIGLGYEKAAARTEASGAAGSLDYDLPVTLVRGFCQIRKPTEGPLRWGVGLGLGKISLEGDMKRDVTGSDPLDGPAAGSGLLVEGFLVVDYGLARAVAVGLETGYRRAKISEVKVDGETLTVGPTSYDKYGLHFNGIFARLGVKYAFEF